MQCNPVSRYWMFLLHSNSDNLRSGSTQSATWPRGKAEKPVRVVRPVCPACDRDGQAVALLGRYDYFGGNLKILARPFREAIARLRVIRRDERFVVAIPSDPNDDHAAVRQIATAAGAARLHETPYCVLVRDELLGRFRTGWRRSSPGWSSGNQQRGRCGTDECKLSCNSRNRRPADIRYQPVTPSTSSRLISSRRRPSSCRRFRPLSCRARQRPADVHYGQIFLGFFGRPNVFGSAEVNSRTDGLKAAH